MTTTTDMVRTNGSGTGLPMSPTDFAERAAEAIDNVIGKGDLSRMSAGERVNLYRRTCESLGLNPLTKPFEYVELQGKLRFYATKGCTDQLRKINKVSIPAGGIQEAFDPQTGLLRVTATATLPDGREDTDFGVVSLKGLTGEALANATMKAITKAKRRVTLSICGLGWLDETEVDSIPDARLVQVDSETGEITEDTRITRDATPRAERMLPQEQVSQVQASAGTPNGTPACTSCGKALTKAQNELSIRNYGAALCPGCQKSPGRTPQATPPKEQRPAPPAAPPAPALGPGESPWDKVVQIMRGYDVGQKHSCFERFLHRYGTKNVKEFGEAQILEALRYLETGEWPHEAAFQAAQARKRAEEEDDPFAEEAGDEAEFAALVGG